MAPERPKRGRRIDAGSPPSVALFLWSDQILKALDWFVRMKKRNLDFGHFRPLFRPPGVAAYRDLAKMAKIRIFWNLSPPQGPKSEKNQNIFWVALNGIKKAYRLKSRLGASISRFRVPKCPKIAFSGICHLRRFWVPCKEAGKRGRKSQRGWHPQI